MTAQDIKLDRSFYVRPTLEVATELIGKFLVYRTGKKVRSARLVEVEAYVGESDPACHAAPGKTARNEVMYHLGGHCYIYFIYGMYHCLNVVTEDEGFPAAVLVRAAEPVEGIALMRRQFSDGAANMLTNGPGKLCKAFGLTREQNGLDLTGPDLYLEDRGYRPTDIKRSQRIGIKKGADKRWRFFEPSSPYVSGRRK